MKDGIVI